MTITPQQIRQARALLRWHQDDLAARAGVSRSTVVKIEHGANTTVGTMAKIQATFEVAGIAFDHDGGVRSALAHDRR